MEKITEREQKLLDVIKKLINIITIWGIYEDKTKKLRVWAYESMKEVGLTNEFQDEMLHMMENEFGIKYTKLNPETLEEVKQEENGK
jgi:hypothetical protein